jgi:hypothetical protein
MEYFKMLNGPTYKTLVRQFWVRAHVYDRNATKLEETEKILIDPTLEGKTREDKNNSYAYNDVPLDLEWI